MSGQPPAMKCPRCVQRIHRAAESCPHCGFSIADADAQFGVEEVRLRRLTDSAGILRRGDREQVAAAMERITRRLPQVFVAVYTGALGEVANIRQFGFWLLNRSAFEDVPVDQPNEAGILLTIDPESKAAGMVFGYLLDPFLEEADTFECLSRGHAYWLEQRYAEGIVRVLARLRSHPLQAEPPGTPGSGVFPTQGVAARDDRGCGARDPCRAPQSAGARRSHGGAAMRTWQAKVLTGVLLAGAWLLAAEAQTAGEAPDHARPGAEEIAASEKPVAGIPEKFWRIYFRERPRTLLVDPQGLLSSVDFRERLAFLNYHAGDSAIDLFVYVFKGDQEIPAEVRAEECIAQCFTAGRPAVIVYYFLGAPQRSALYLSPSLTDVVPATEQRRALESAVMQAVGKVDGSGQFEAFLVQMSIRIYWMERMLGGEGAAVGEMPAVVRKATTHGEKSATMEKLRPLLERARRFTVPAAVLGGLLVAAGVLGSWLRRRARYRFPELDVEPRLGGAHAAGVGAVISFASAALASGVTA